MAVRLVHALELFMFLDSDSKKKKNEKSPESLVKASMFPQTQGET